MPDGLFQNITSPSVIVTLFELITHYLQDGLLCGPIYICIDYLNVFLRR